MTAIEASKAPAVDAGAESTASGGQFARGLCLFVLVAIPSAFWPFMIWLGAALAGYSVGFAPLMVVAALIAAFLTLVCSAAMAGE